MDAVPCNDRSLRLGVHNTHYDDQTSLTCNADSALTELTNSRTGSNRKPPTPNSPAERKQLHGPTKRVHGSLNWLQAHRGCIMWGRPQNPGNRCMCALTLVSSLAILSLSTPASKCISSHPGQLTLLPIDAPKSYTRTSSTRVTQAVRTQDIRQPVLVESNSHSFIHSLLHL